MDGCSWAMNVISIHQSRYLSPLKDQATVSILPSASPMGISSAFLYIQSKVRTISLIVSPSLRRVAPSYGTRPEHSAGGSGSGQAKKRTATLG